MSNPRPLSDHEYVAFMEAWHPDLLPSIPQWGAIFEWEGRYVLAYWRPDGAWALTDISGGIPWRDRWIPAGAIVQALSAQYADNGGVWYAVSSSFGETVAAVADALGYAAGWTATEVNNAVQTAAQAVGQAAGNILAPTAQSLALPLVAIGIAALLIYLPRPRAS